MDRLGERNFCCTLVSIFWETEVNRVRVDHEYTYKHFLVYAAEVDA